ncbi:hypothetical protein DFJ74DRAFT_760618 [Hyaloraphidium curvatum]|nr:hypothetical protein DFJ74DRAFT_760618 [Hyaloraphidium curvatum]
MTYICSSGRCVGAGPPPPPANPCANVNCGDYSSCSGGTCTCNSGYTSSSNDGRNCRPIDPCAGVNCGAFSSCTGGSCTCNPGFTSDGNSGRNCYCPSGQKECGGYCVATSSDRNNCGHCGNSCPTDSIGCSSGACQFRPTCPSGQTNCGSESSVNCVVLDSNAQNCGKCGTACPSGQSCSGGRCVCPRGLTNCNGFCVSTDSDRNHCGRCGASCPADSTGCSSSVCQFRPISTSNAVFVTSTFLVPSSRTSLLATTSSVFATTSSAPVAGATSTVGSGTTFASVPSSAVVLPAGATSVTIEPGSKIFIASGAKGLSCNPECSLADGSSGEYAVGRVPDSSAILLQRGSSCLQVRRSGTTASVLDESCPGGSAGRRRRQVGALPYWTLFNSSGTTKVMNANLGASAGCLQVPSEGPVTLGSCSSAQAGLWTVSASSAAPPPPPPPSNIGAIVGGVVGGVVALGAIGGLTYYGMKRKRAAAADHKTDASSEEDSQEKWKDIQGSTLTWDPSQRPSLRHP